jgi:integrase
MLAKGLPNMPPRTLTDKTIAALKVAKRTNIADPKLAGHYVRVTPNGAKSFCAVARDPRGKQVWHTIGSTDLHTLEEARDLARAAMKRIKLGADRAGPQSYESVARDWFKRHVEKKGILSAKGIRRYLDKHILPEWGGRDFESIKRIDIARLLDNIEDTSGPASADEVLIIVRAICNWYATRNDNYVSPVVKGMQRSNRKERAQTRILSDDEIRLVWRQAESNSTFGALVRLLLLTGQRREKVASMRWEHLRDGIWYMPKAKREKGVGGDLRLPEKAIDIINAQPRFLSTEYVLAGRVVGTHFRGYGKAKAAFDAKLPPMPQWGLHDLRRTARSLMARAGVRPDVAERTLGHAMGEIEDIYNRHSYFEEKAHALKALAGLIELILAPQDSKVRSLRG